MSEKHSYLSKTNEVFDDNLNKSQAEINLEVWKLLSKGDLSEISKTLSNLIERVETLEKKIHETPIE